MGHTRNKRNNISPFWFKARKISFVVFFLFGLILNHVFIVGESRTTLVDQNERLNQAFRILTESYQLALATLVTLHNKYLRSKEVKNILHRYTQMREMIKVSSIIIQRLAFWNNIKSCSFILRSNSIIK